MFAYSKHYMRPFFRNPWLVCDLFVVTFMLVGLIFKDLPAVNVIRLIRVFKDSMYVYLHAHMAAHC